MTFFKLIFFSSYLVILKVFLLTFQSKECAGSDIVFSPHDIAIERNDGSRFCIYLRVPPPPDEDVTIDLHVDHANVLTLSNYSASFNTTNLESCITVKGYNPGKVVVTVDSTGLNYSLDDAFVRINVNVHNYIDILAIVFGWLYFVSYSSGFFPQIYLNFRRKSVIGLNMDFIVLNLIGTFVFSVFNLSLYYGPEIQRQYNDVHPFGIIPVYPQDIALSIVQFSLSVICGLQGFHYNREALSLSKICMGLIVASALFLIISIILAFVDVINWLTCVYYFSYVKLGVTGCKYIPQVNSNYKKRSTTGWSIGFPILDYCGGSMSIIQMILMAYNYDDWRSIYGNPSKLILASGSFTFSTIFIFQFFIYGKSNKSPESDDEKPVCDTTKI